MCAKYSALHAPATAPCSPTRGLEGTPCLQSPPPVTLPTAGGGDNCNVMGISHYWIINRNKIFSICFFFTPYLIEAIKYILVITNRFYFNLDINIYFQQRTFLLQQEGEEAVTVTPSKY